MGPPCRRTGRVLFSGTTLVSAPGPPSPEGGTYQGVIPVLDLRSQPRPRAHLAMAAAALALAGLAAGCQNVVRKLPPYSVRVLAAGPATEIAAAPDGSWFVTGAGQSWRILASGATASWDLPRTPRAQPGVSKVAGLAISPSGRIAVADPTSNLVWNAGTAASPSTRVKPLAGTGTTFYPIGDGGLAIAAQIAHPEGVAWGPRGDLFVSDTGHNRVRWVGLDGRIFTLAGRGFPEPLGDGGPAANAGLWEPGPLATSQAGDVFVVDEGHDRVRVIRDRVIRTVAFESGKGLAVDRQGTLFVTRKKQVDAFVDGHRTVVARDLHAPVGIAADGRGDLAVADGDRVVLLSPRG